ncbi:hypothetical protein GCM10012287_40870 [Streptomyces daqingensis]|uniref:Immunity protein 49 n=1 Tax=Streptomyces daqingensis TaxID=1472640 RepID=A0ABQ2MKX9_9ACTN|nr:immunity 49 family protein [Streptomyces daqingensis]GGO53669.1 hypothetical protein GCM10012287_40870 [Streptomyces daqingensis]
MVRSVPRHDYPTDNVTEGLEVLSETVSWVMERLEESDVARGQALGVTLNFASTRCAVDTKATKIETWEAWVTAMQVGSALFASASANEEGAECRIGGEVKHLPATGPQPYANAGAWITSFCLAMICRDNQRLNRLAEVPISLLRDSGAVFDEYIYAWVEALQGFWTGRDDVGEKLVAAVDGTNPEVSHSADPELMAKILYPPIILFYRYLRGDHAQFNAALSDALRWHKEYWTADDDRAMSSDGLVALVPLAMACLARDARFPIEVESEYMPEALLDFSWAGEIETG